MDTESKRQELEALRQRVAELEADLNQDDADRGWRPTGLYPAYAATAGFLLGIFGAMTSLLFNVIGGMVAGKDPLELIRVYLTFPLGEKALQLANQAQPVYAVGDGVILAIGCCLYLLTGMFLGVPVYLALATFASKGGFVKRSLVATVSVLAIWAISFYGVLSWLQPMLFGGNWITDNSRLPWWVAAATHVVFGITIVLAYPLGEYTPYSRPIDEA